MMVLYMKIPEHLQRFCKMWSSGMYANASVEYYRDLWKLIFYFFLVVVFFVLIAVFYTHYEGWTVNESLFFMIFTLTTVGYGSPAPSDDFSRLFTILFIILCIGVIFSGISDLIHNHITWLQNLCCKSSSVQVAEDIMVGDIYHFRKQLFGFIAVLISWAVFGAIILKYNEDWSWITSFYYMVQTTTVCRNIDYDINSCFADNFYMLNFRRLDTAT